MLKQGIEENRVLQEMLKKVKIVERENPCKVTLHSTAATAIRTAQAKKSMLTKENLQRLEREDMDAVPKKHRLNEEEFKDFNYWSGGTDILTRKLRSKELTRRLVDSRSNSIESFEKGKKYLMKILGLEELCAEINPNKKVSAKFVSEHFTSSNAKKVSLLMPKYFLDIEHWQCYFQRE